MEHGIDKSRLVASDFNVVLYPNDRLYGISVSLAKTQDFTNCLYNLQINELPWKGDFYTWSNK